MAKIKYDVSKVDDQSDWEHVKPGLYICVIEEIKERVSSNEEPMLEIRLRPVKDAHGKKITEPKNPSSVFTYAPLPADSTWAGRMKDFIAAVGLKPKGEIDPDALKGTEVQAKLKSDKDLDGNYRPSVSKLMKTVGEPEEPDEAEDEAEGDDDAESLESVLAELDRKGLKALIKEHELDVTVLKKDSDDDIRAKITEAWPDEEDEETPDYAAMALADLKALCKQRGLSDAGKKPQLVQRLEKDDETDDEPF